MRISLILAALLCLCLSAQTAAAQDPPELLGGITSAGDSIDGILDEIRKAEEALEKARQAGDTERSGKIEESLEEKERDLDRARAEKLSRESGTSETEILRMRQSGMGWGRIAKEVGVHPGMLGVRGQAGDRPGKNGGVYSAEEDEDGSSRGNPGKGKGRSKSKGGKSKNKQ